MNVIEEIGEKPGKSNGEKIVVWKFWNKKNVKTHKFLWYNITLLRN